MAHLITFQTRKFDLQAEPANPINPIAGAGVLRWLRERLAGTYEWSEPEPEDWGWFCSVGLGDAVYLVGASADLDQPQPVEWAVQIDKRRSLIDKLAGRNRLSPNEPLTAAIHSAIESEPDFSAVTIDTSAG